MENNKAKELVDDRIHYEEVKRLLVKLVQFPSPQTALLEKEPQVLALIREVVKPELERAGLEPILDDTGNLLVRLKGKGSGKRLLWVTYGMNAAPSTMPNPYSGEIVDGTPYEADGECVWGRGACEQKGSLAAMMAALRLLAQEELPGDLYFVTSTAGETGRHDSLAHILDYGKVDADWAIVDGPPEIQLGNKGRVDILVTIEGKQAHSSRPWDGVNAIDGAMKVLERLKALMPYPEAKIHPELGKVTLTPNAIESFPKATHTIQGECRIMFDRRLLPGDDPTAAVRQLEQAIGDLEPFKVDVQARDFMYPSEVAKDAEVVRALSGAVSAMLGKEAQYSYSTAANDTGLLNVRGMQAINFGARDIRFQHTDHDLVSVSSVFRAARVFALLGMCR